MDQRLARLIPDHRSSVSRAVDLIQRSGIPLPATADDWLSNRIPQFGELVGGVPYFKHGYGCSVRLPEEAINFDLGENGEVNGSDLWRMVDFAGSRLSEYGFTSGDEANSCFAVEVKRGSFVFSGYILYYTAEKKTL